MHTVIHHSGEDERTIVEHYRDRLAEAGRLNTPEGAHVMTLVHLLHHLQRNDITAGAAALSKELRDSMTLALKNAQGTDSVDMLMARRRARITGA
jgi:hypothetical protein